MEMSISQDEGKVHYISTDTIRPPLINSDTNPRLELTPWDLSLLALHCIQKGLLFHKPNGETWINHLKSSLSQALLHFFPLAGRLATESHDDDGTISVFINCNNAGAEFIHAKAEFITVSNILNSPHIPHIVHDFFSLNGSINYNGRFEPLLSVQVTELLDGVFIGFSMNHTIVDGTSFWKFINSWSEISKSKSNTNKPPILDRWFLSESDLPVRLPASKIEKAITSPPSTLLEERIFHFAPRNIAKLKEKANAENKNGDGNVIISSLQAVLAHAWVHITRARKMEPDEVIRYILLMGNRGRLSRPHELPEDYFGNAVNHGVAIAKAGELMKEGLGYAAGLLNQTVSSHTEEKICSAWKERVREPVVTSFESYNFKFFLTGSSPRFNVYENDFGWGCPLAVRSGCGNKCDGKLTIYPGAVKGSMEIEASLSPETYLALSDDSDFMEYLGP